MTAEEWRLVARAMAAHDVVDPGGDSHWADHMFGARARQFIAALDAITEYRGTATDSESAAYEDGITRKVGSGPDDVERVARRMARSEARDNHIPADRIDAEVDKYWPQYRDHATEHLDQLRSGNA